MAASDPDQAIRLWVARVPCPATEAACRPWINALKDASPVSEPMNLTPWLDSLPTDGTGQHWRNRALWAAAMALQGPQVACLLRAGAKVDLGDPGTHPDSEEANVSLSPLALLLRRDLRVEACASSSPEDRVVDTVAHWVSAEPGALEPAVASLVPTGYLLRLFNADDLRRLADLGAPFSGSCTPLWLDSLIPDLSRLHGQGPLLHEVWPFPGDHRALQDAVRVVFERGASPLERWPDGDTVLHRLFRFRASSSSMDRTCWCRDSLAAWFDFLVQQGADPAATLPSGDTLLHTAFRHDGGFLPPPPVDHLVALRPLDLFTPGAEGHTPLFLLELQCAGTGDWSPRNLETRMKQSQAHRTRILSFEQARRLGEVLDEQSAAADSPAQLPMARRRRL